MKIDCTKISPLGNAELEFLESLTENPNIKRLIVFGSRAIGDFEPYSDLDLAIDAHELKKSEWLKLKEYLTYDIKSIIKISIVDYLSNPPKLKERIDRTGVVIYEK